MGWTFGYKSRAAALREAFEGIYIHHQVAGRDCVWIMFDDHRGAKAIAVALIERHGTDIGIKVLDETQGPSACDCPLEWLDEVAQPGGFAGNFRRRVREYWAARAPVPARNQELAL
jgi:hypothetical protein